MGTSRTLRFRPPMKENPSSWTSIPSGTMTWTPPQKATAVITTSGPSISAWRRSISHPPMTATAVVRAPTRQRPLAREPLMTATNDRRGGRRVETSWGTATSGRSAMAACKSPWVRAWRARPTRSGELVEGEPALHRVLPELGYRPISFGVGHPDVHVARVAPTGCGGAGFRVGRIGQIGHHCSLLPHAAGRLLREGPQGEAERSSSPCGVRRRVAYPMPGGTNEHAGTKKGSSAPRALSTSC